MWSGSWRLSARRLSVLALVALLGGCLGVRGASFHAAETKAELEAAMRDGDMDRSAELIDDNDDVLSEQVALDVAIRAGLLVPVRYFAARSDINAGLDADGTTPLIRAIQSTPRSALGDVIAQLLEAGADPQRKDNFGRNAIDYAGFTGDFALVRYLQTGGRTAYRSERPVHVAWLPQQTWRNIDLLDRPAGTARVLRQSPLRRFGGGRPDLLLASAWVPRSGTNGIGPLTSLSFNADGTGQVLGFTPRDGRFEPAAASALAWKFVRNQLQFTVVGPDFAAFCESANSGPGRFGVACSDFPTLAPDELGVRSSDPDVLARALLDDDGRRGRLSPIGTTQAVFESAASICTPAKAPPGLRAGLPIDAASDRSPGSWMVFDAGRQRAFSAGGAAVCTQRQARSAAFGQCARANASCRSVGGCQPGQAMALASVGEHGWAALGCGANLGEARARALQACREQAGCVCQVLFASPDGDIRSPIRGCLPARG